MNSDTEVVTLTCWKDIANYLGKGVRTVQRWEQEFGLPIRRPKGATHKSPVSASRRDLDAWLDSNWSIRAAKIELNGFSGEKSVTPIESGTNILQDAQKALESSKDLHARLHLVREQHRDLVHQVGVAITTLNLTCQRLAASQQHTSDS